MSTNFTISNPMTNNAWSGWEGMISFLKCIVKESMEEVIQNKMYENVVADQKLTSQQLCDRWKISQNTLHNWENRGIISPIKTGGKKKVYSLNDIREVEVNGYIKNACLC